ncbi:monocarboxylate transporter 12-like isoform X2 [Ptychodera flava]
MTVLLGTIISSTGYFISAFAPTIEFLYLSIGLAIGLGYAIILPACIGIKAFFIKKRFPIANVLAGSGAGLGVFIFPPLLQTLIDNYGWKGAVIVFSALNAQMGIAAALFRAPEEHNRSASKSEEDVKIAKSSRTCLTSAVDTCDFWLLKKFPTFAIFVLATGISDGIGYQGSPSHMLARAKTKHIGSITDISLLVSIFGLATIIGRLVIPILLYLTGKYTTSLKLYSVAIVLSGTCNLFSPLASNYGGYSTYAFIYGLFMGIVMGIRPQIARDILGPEKVTAGIGLMKFCIAFGALIGPPTGGYIYDVTDEYDNSFYFYGSLLVFGGLMILVLEPLTTRRQRTLEGVTNVIVDEPCRYSVSFLEVATQTGEKH